MVSGNIEQQDQFQFDNIEGRSEAAATQLYKSSLLISIDVHEPLMTSKNTFEDQVQSQKKDTTTTQEYMTANY